MGYQDNDIHGEDTGLAAPVTSVRPGHLVPPASRFSTAHLYQYDQNVTKFSISSFLALLFLGLPVGGGLRATPVEEGHLETACRQRPAELLVHLLVDARHAQEQRGPHVAESLDQGALRRNGSDRSGGVRLRFRYKCPVPMVLIFLMS